MYQSLLACALSFQDRNDEARTASLAAEALAVERPVRPHDRLILDQDTWFVEGALAFDAGDLAGAEAWGRKVIDADVRLAEEYREPRGWFYAAIAAQWLLRDPDLAHQYYARGREAAPSILPPWIEEARLYRDSGAPESAARLLWTYITCFPTSGQVGEALEVASEWGLLRPTEKLPCP